MPRDVLCAALVALSLLLSSPVRASRLEDLAEDLARAAVHEAGLLVEADEVAALYAVMQARCSGSPRCQMRRFFRGQTTRPWVLWLRRDGTRPWLWPEGASWELARPRWLRVLDIADRVVRGEIEASCEPDAWGMRSGRDWDRAQRGEWIELDCAGGSGVPTRNAFWRFP
jgi:hypothetical protein